MLHSEWQFPSFIYLFSFSTFFFEGGGGGGGGEIKDRIHLVLSFP